MQRPLVLFSLACALVASLSVGLCAASRGAALSVTFDDAFLRAPGVPASVADRVAAAALRGGSDCIVAHARSWTLHVFCVGNSSDEAVAQRLRRAEPSLIVEPLAHRGRFDAHTAKALDGGIGDCLRCCLVVRALVGSTQSADALRDYLARVAPAPAAAWSLHMESNRVAFASACSFPDGGASIREIVAALHGAGGADGVNVISVALVHPSTPSNWYSRGVLSDGNPGSDFFRAVGVLGRGTVIGCADTGIDADHCFFDDPDVPLVYDAPMAAHRKIARYARLVSATDPESGRDEVPGHGTHVAGTLVGMPLPGAPQLTAAVARHHGFAPQARVSFVDIGGSSGISTPTQISQLFDPARGDGATVHSNSWGSRGGAAQYTDQARQIDMYADAFPAFLPVFASGNDADTGCVDGGTKQLKDGDVVCDHYSAVAPGTCKNALCVGSSVAPLASWQEADYGNFVLEVRAAVSETQQSELLPLDRGGAGVLATFDAVHGQFGASHPRVDAGKLVFVDPADACSDLRNADKLVGAVAVVTRGTCIFTEKAERLQRAGVALMVVINTEVGPAIQMGAAGAHTTIPLTIAAVMISQESGAKLHQLESLYSAARLRLSLHETSRPLATKNRHDLSAFSGRGPTRDLRYKPDLVAPGEFVHSAASDGDPASHNCNLWASMGTSMATPQIAASAALVREYLTRNLHRAPDNSSSGGTGSTGSPTAAGIKAVLILAAVPLTGVVDRNLHGDIRQLSEALSPSFEQGHGILRLASVLPNYAAAPPGSDADNESPRYSAAARQNGVTLLDADDASTTVGQGDVRSFCFEYVNASTLPFRAVLSWTDPAALLPPSDADAQRDSLLIDDLDLIVDDAAGRRFRGNMHGADPPEVGDDRNNVEKVHAATSAKSRFFLVSVHGKRIASGTARRFALAVSSGHARPLSSCKLIQSLSVHRGGSAVATAIGCVSNAECGADHGRGTCAGGRICLCERGYRGLRCQIAPQVLPHEGVRDGRVYPMQVQEYAFLLTRSAAPPSASSSGDTPASLRVSLRSMQRDGDPNVYARFDAPLAAFSPIAAVRRTTAAVLDECDDCTPAAAADVPRDVRIARIGSTALEPQSEDGRDKSTLFLTVSAGCCWWARYELVVAPSVASMRVVPALITAARVHRTAASGGGSSTAVPSSAPSALDAHFFEFLIEVRGEQPVLGRLRSRDAVGEDALVPALSAVEQHASWCNGALRECVMQFPVAAVQALLCNTPNADGEQTPTAPSIRRTMLSLELTYSLNRTVRTDLVPGASAALNCSLLQALPLVTLPPHSAAANTGAPAPQPTPPSSPSGDTKTMHMALLVSKIADHCERALLGDYGDSAAASASTAAAARTTSDDWSVAEGPVLRPAPSCFFSKEGSDVELSTTQWLILPSSIADFPVRIAVRVNLALLNATRRIASTDFLRIAFRSRATAAVHPCSRVEISDEEKEQVLLKQQEEQQAEIVVCDIGGGGAEHFIRPQTPLFLQITDMYAPNGDEGTIVLDDVGVVVAAPPQAAGFATSFAPNSPAVETDFVLSHSATHVQLVALGSYFSPAVWDDAFGVAENGPEALPAGASAQTVAAAPQIEFALRSLARLFLAPADDTEQYSLGSFAFVRCAGHSGSGGGRSANVTRDRLSCAVPRGAVQCGVPLTLHLNVDRVLYGSSTELIPNSVMFPAIECGLAILGIDGPGRAVHGARLPPPAESGASPVDIIFNIVGQFGTVRYAGVSLEPAEADGGRNVLQFGAATAAVNVTAVPPPECRVRSTAVKMLNVACSVTAEHRRVAMAGDTRPVMYTVAVHGTDLAGDLEFTFWKTEQGEQQDLMLMLLPSRFAASVLDDAAPPTVAAVANGGAAAILRLPLRAAAGFLPPAAAAQAVVGAVAGRPLFLHVRLGEHHPCEVLNNTAQLLQLARQSAGGDSLYCVAPTVALTFSGAAAGRGGANAEGSAPTLRLELWVAGQDLPVFDGLAVQQLSGGAFDFLQQQQLSSASSSSSSATALNTTLIRFAARPSSALLAALSQHHARRFEIAAAVFYPPASGRAPAYFEVDDAAAGELRLSLFAVNGAAARFNPCRGATASPMLRETLSDMHAVRLSRRQRRGSSRGGDDDVAAVVYPARFDGVTYPCGREPSAWSFAGTVLDQEEAWMQRRAFFVAVCATLGTAHFGGGFVANVPAVQVAEFRPPRFVALHASSSVRVRTTSSSSGGGGAFAADDGDGYEREDHATSHMRQSVVQLTLPGCDNTTRTPSSGSSSDSNAQPRQQPQLEQERLYIDRGVSLIVGVTVNVALYDSEVREMRRAEMNASEDGTGVLTPLVAVDRIFFSRDPKCAAPPLTSTRIVADSSASSTATSSSSAAATTKKQKVAVTTLAARMNPLLTTLHVHDEHWWSRTTASYTFTASDALHTRDFETAAFPARAVFVCAAWSGRTDALVFQHQAGRDGVSSAAAASSSGARTTSHTARIAVAQLGACTRDSDCDGSDSVCVHRLCQCSADRRGAWCEKQCPVVVVPASISSGSGSAGSAVVCSGHGTCNAVAVCECSAHYTGATCSAELRAAGEQTLSRAEAASGQARGKLEARMLLTRGDLLRASTGSRLHLALDGLPTGRQLRVVLFAPSLFKSGGSDAALFRQRRTLPDGRAVVLKRTPIVTFWTAAAAGGGPVVVVADSSTAVGGGGTGSSNGDEDYIARSPTFAAQGVLAPAPFRALTVEIPPLADLFDKNSAVAAATSSPSTAAPASSASEQIVIDVSVFMDADAPSEGGCESWICAVIAICAGIAGAAVGFGGVFLCTRWWSERKQRRLAEQQRNHAAAAASGTTATVIPPSVSD